MKKINISTKKYPNKFAIVDDEDYIKLLNYGNWYFDNNKHKGNATSVSHGHKEKMHRFLMNCPIGKIIDHVNGDTLDNRKCNLRICDYINNSHNRGPNKDKKSSQYKGVFRFDSKRNPWVVRIGYNGRYYNIGYFKTEKQAAKQYNCAARIFHGEFAYLNEV
jgi:hypothetical protein